MGRLTEWVGTDENRHAIPRTDIRKNGHQRCCNKLAHYEDLEEQGRLIEQKHGTWLEADDGDGVVCSVCRTDFCTLIFETDSFIYCPNCGAKMSKEEE